MWVGGRRNVVDGSRSEADAGVQVWLASSQVGKGPDIPMAKQYVSVWKPIRACLLSKEVTHVCYQ